MRDKIVINRPKFFSLSIVIGERCECSCNSQYEPIIAYTKVIVTPNLNLKIALASFIVAN